MPGGAFFKKKNIHIKTRTLSKLMNWSISQLQAEARFEARRQARARAREMRLKEMEKKKRRDAQADHDEYENNVDRWGGEL